MFLESNKLGQLYYRKRKFKNHLPYFEVMIGMHYLLLEFVETVVAPDCLKLLAGTVGAPHYSQSVVGIAAVQRCSLAFVAVVLLCLELLPLYSELAPVYTVVP